MRESLLQDPEVFLSAPRRPNAEIARLLYMSEATVKAHISRVLTKLNATNRVQVAIVMRDAGLT